jgi:hypothetical protein
MTFEINKDQIFKLLKSGESEVQKFAALKMTEGYSKREFSASERQIVEDIFRVLCQKADVFVRIILSESLKNCNNLPHDIALKLAKDAVEVAVPMLQYSEVLTDEDLCEIIDETVRAKRLAIARRPSLTKRVITKLFGTKDKLVNEAIIKNENLRKDSELFGELWPKIKPWFAAKAEAWRQALPKLVVLNATKFVVCPEIRRGRSEITCTGTKDSISCDLCVRGLANVLFPAH